MIEVEAAGDKTNTIVVLEEELRAHAHLAISFPVLYFGTINPPFTVSPPGLHSHIKHSTLICAFAFLGGHIFAYCDCLGSVVHRKAHQQSCFSCWVKFLLSMFGNLAELAMPCWPPSGQRGVFFELLRAYLTIWWQKVDSFLDRRKADLSCGAGDVVQFCWMVFPSSI